MDKLSEGFNSVIVKLEKEAEKKSWKADKITKFRVYLPRCGELFRLETAEQSKDYPRGITKEAAKKLAGKDGVVLKIVTITQRIK